AFPNSATETATITFATAANPNTPLFSQNPQFTINNGVASVTIDPQTILSQVLPVGSYIVKVTYGGDGSFNPAGPTSASQAIGHSTTAANVGFNASPAVFGQAVVVTANISAALPGGAAPLVGANLPSGTATFYLDGAALLPAATVTNGVASI